MKAQFTSIGQPILNKDTTGPNLFYYPPKPTNQYFAPMKATSPLCATVVSAQLAQTASFNNNKPRHGQFSKYCSIQISGTVQINYKQPKQIKKLFV